jgi:hypothetical protein
MANWVRLSKHNTGEAVYVNMDLAIHIQHGGQYRMIGFDSSVENWIMVSEDMDTIIAKTRDAKSKGEY